jgi:hypothetical protein
MWKEATKLGGILVYKSNFKAQNIVEFTPVARQQTTTK